VDAPLLSRQMKITLIAAAIAAGLFYVLRDVVAPVAFAFLLAYFLDPVVDRLEARKLLRTNGILVILGAALIVLMVVVVVFVPLVIEEAQRFIARLPGLLTALADRLGPLLKQWTGLDANEWLDQSTARLSAYAHKLTAADLAPVTRILGSIFSGTYAALLALVSLFIIPIFSFYFLRDFDRLKRKPLDWVPPRHREWLVAVVKEIDDVLAGFVRGQVTVCLILAALYSLGYAVSGVPLGVLIGLFAGLLSFIPYFGSGVGAGLAVLLCLLDWSGWGPLVGAGATFAVVQTLESFVITPRIVGDRVGLSPLVVIIALMVGGELFGFAGVLVALPAAAVVNILWRRAGERYRRTSFFTGGQA